MRVVVAEALVIVMALAMMNWISLCKRRLIDGSGRGSSGGSRRRRPCLGQSIADGMYPGTTLLHISGCMRTTLLQSRVLGMPYSADVLGCIVLCLCISLVH